MNRLGLSLLFLVAALGACSGRDSAPESDASTMDGTVNDASVSDSAFDDGSAADSSTMDSGAADAGSMDSGTDGGATDTGVSDASTSDSGALDSGAADSGSADGGTPTAGVTYLVEHDSRRCAYPRCGGFWLSAVNQADTLCDDGTRADRCYAVDFDWTALHITARRISEAEGAAGGLLVEGTLQTADFVGGARLGHLVVADGWIAEWGSVVTSSTMPPFYVAADNGMRCLVAPCFNHDLTLINVGSTGTASGLDLSRVGASSAQQAAGTSAEIAGVLRVTGVVADDAMPGPGGLGRTLTATQFYMPLAR